MMLHYKIISIDDTSLVSLQETKSYLKIDHDDDDGLLKDCIVTSIETAENFLNFSLRVKTVLLNSNLGVISKIVLPILPFAEVVSCEILHRGGNSDVSDCCFVSQDQQYLNIAKPIQGQVKLIYKAGFVDKSLIPMSIKQGILYHIAEIYDKQVISNSFMEEVLSFYKSFRRILI